MKKVYLLSGLGIVMIFIVVWLASYLSSGAITVTSNNKNSAIVLVKTSEGKPFTKVGMGSLSASVGHGMYTATVRSGAQTSVQVINFDKGHKTFRYSIPLLGLLNVEPVTHQSATNMTAGNGTLLYLNGNDGDVYKIDNSNNLAPITTSQSFQIVKWANTTFGVGQDTGGHLYVINDGNVSTLNVPFSYNGASINFAVTPNKQIYVSHGADVYLGTQAGNFKKIYIAGISNPVLEASASQVAVVGGESFGEDANKESVLTTISTDGNIEQKEGVDVGEAGDMEWSPNGKYLLVLDEEGATIYDNSLHEVLALPPNSTMAHPAWLDNNTVFYSENNELWKYSLNAQRASLVSRITSGNFITGMAVSDGGSYVYVTATDFSGNNYVISRIGLRGQQVPDYIYKLEGIMPLTLNDEVLNMVNFSQNAPTILIEPSDNNLSTQGYINEAQDGLAQAGLNSNNLQLKVSTANAQE